MSQLPTVVAGSTFSEHFPELAAYSLGSLKKYARSRSLRAARIALILACIIMALQATLVYMFKEDHIAEFEKKARAEVKKKGFFVTVNEQKLSEVKATLRKVYDIFSWGMYGFAAAFLLLGLLVYRFPLFCSVGGLILYLGFHLIMAYLISRAGSVVNVMEFLLMWWPAKIIIILGLLKGIHTAVLFQRERTYFSGQAAMQVQPSA